MRLLTQRRFVRCHLSDRAARPICATGPPAPAAARTCLHRCVRSRPATRRPTEGNHAGKDQAAAALAGQIFADELHHVGQWLTGKCGSAMRAGQSIKFLFILWNHPSHDGNARKDFISQHLRRYVVEFRVRFLRSEKRFSAKGLHRFSAVVPAGNGNSRHDVPRQF